MTALSAKTKSRRPLDPQYITLDITYRCPLACRFCFMAKSSAAAKPAGEMTPRQLARLVDSLAGKRRKFYISGGEPLLRPDLPALVKRIKAAGHYCRVITSLSHAPASVEKLFAAGLDELTVSVHGTPAIHDACVGRPGAFAKIAQVCARLNAPPRRASSRLVFWCTVNKANHARLHSVYKALAALGPDAIAFHHLDFITARDLAETAGIFKSELGCAANLKVSQDLARGISARRLYAQIHKIKAEKDPRVRFDLELSAGEMRKWYDPASRLSKKGFCMSPWNGVWIAPSGEIVSCQPLGHRLGSALKDGCLGAFNSPAYAGFRKALLRRGGFLPTCSRCGRTAYMSGSRDTSRRPAP
ncbi:MAG: radical SAM protein [Elusimicrobia bacterium]|nr:radical SAM protein [Elusimicrobiota bacterium]